jgi:predicted signal transduction protein with EAL and GGDEF domain
VGAQTVYLTCSVGVSWSPEAGNDAAQLLGQADLALNQAKQLGRNRVVLFSAERSAEMAQRIVVGAEMREALQREEIRLHYQPLVDAAGGGIAGAEALMRWNNARLGAVSPARFIPVAEDTGMIVAIGEWVLREACRIAAHWPERVNVAVNLSTVQFRNRNLFDSVKGALESSGLSPARLELEVTESLLLTESDATLRMLHRLRSLGVRISMDDFGTGYSSLSYLRSFPFDKIKIDQSFVKSLAAKEDSRAIVKAVIGLGSSLGMSTTAEGVETESQLDLVRQQGCTEVQGFLFSPPLPASAIDKLFSGKSGLEAWSRSLKRSG